MPASNDTTAAARGDEGPRLVIFDCDGVLVDSERLQIELEVAYVAELGLPMTFDEVAHQFMGRSEADMMRELEGRLGGPLPPGWRERWQADTRQALATRLTAVPGVGEAIDALHAAGLLTCVGSSGTPERIRRSLAATGLAERLGDRLFSAMDVAAGKPAPDLFLHAARSLGVDPDHCVVVEDSPYGIAAALAAGMTAVGYAAGLVPAARLGDAHAVIDTMADLAATVDALRTKDATTRTR